MAKSRLVVFYHYGPGNEGIAKTDYQDFFGPVKNAILDKNELQIEAVYCPEVKVFVDKIDLLTSEPEGLDNLYLHFSGHGNTPGIPYGDWILDNQDLAYLLDHEKIKCCFFSSCKSSELVKVVNRQKIPVVIGTSGENDIENQFAIGFQKEFYLALLKSRTFEEAFNYAGSKLRQVEGLAMQTDSFTRGEGGEELMEENINQLQIAFCVDKDKELRIIPTNFLQEMGDSEFSKPFCLNWFDNHTEADDFGDAFKSKGFHERLEYLTIPNDQLPLLNKRGDEDPLLMGDLGSSLIIHCSSDKVLEEHIRTHLNAENTFFMEHYSVFFCLKNTVDKQSLFDSEKLLKRIPKENFFTYKHSSTELLDNDDFIQAMDRQQVSFSDRKEITFRFEANPNKKELNEITDVSKYVRVFFAGNANERLVNFLINWFKSKEELTCPVYQLDNIGNTEMDIQTELIKLLARYTDEKDELKKQFYELHKSGAIIVIRNRSDKVEDTVATLNELIASLEDSSSFFGKKSKTPTLLFFLHDKPEVLPTGEKEHIVLKRLSRPCAVDDDMVTRWYERHNTDEESTKVRQAVKEITDDINPRDFNASCPSEVVAVICDKFKIPRKQIVGI